MPAPSDATRVDRFLFAVRLYKTRALATAACRAGHVSVNGARARAAHSLRAGDRVRVHDAHRRLDLEVLTPIARRVGAPEARAAFIDHSPPAPAPAPAPGAARRPTKRDRRQIDALRGRR